MKTNRSKNGFKGIVFGVANKLLVILAPFIVRTIIIYKLGNDYLGLNSLFSSILQILSLTELGIGSAMVFYLYKPLNDEDYEKVSSLLKMYRKIYRIIGLLILIIGLMVLPFLKFLIYGDTPSDVNIYLLFIIYLSNTTLSYLFFTYRITFLNACQKSHVVSNISSLSLLFMYGSQIIVLLLFKNYYVYIIFLPISTIINNLLIYFYTKPFFKKLNLKIATSLNKDEEKAIFKKTGALFGHKLGAVLISSMDNIVISSLLGLTSLAVFNNYYYIVTSINAVVDIIMNAILFSLGNFILNKNKDEIYNLFMKLTFAQACLVFFCFFCLMGLYKDFMMLWVKEDNTYNSLWMIVLFSLYFYSWKFRSIGLTFKDAAGMWKNDMIKPYIGVAINIVLDIVLVYNIGVAGALISTIFIFIFVYFPWETYVLFKDLFGRNPVKYLIRIFIYFVITIGCGVGALFISNVYNADNFLRFSLKALIVILSASTIVFLLTFWTQEFKYFSKKIFSFIKK